MKLTIKTLKQKTLTVEIEETKTVYELKKELSLNEDVGVAPESQQLIYCGQILNNNEQLTAYNIDEGKCLVVMILIQPSPSPPPSVNVEEANQGIEDLPSGEAQEIKYAECLQEEFIPMPSDEEGGDMMIYDDDMVDDTIIDDIIDDDDMFDGNDVMATFLNMGFSEHEIRHAIETYADYSNIDIDIIIINVPRPNYDHEDTDMVGIDVQRQDGRFNNTRHAVVQDDDLLSVDVQTSGDLLDLLDENERASLIRLLEDAHNEDDDEEENEESEE